LLFIPNLDGSGTSVKWGDYIIESYRSYSPDYRSMSYVFTADDIKYAVIGRLLLPEGRLRNIKDMWSKEFWYSDNKPVLEGLPRIESSVKRLQSIGVAKFLPEIGEPYSSEAAKANYDLLSSRMLKIHELLEKPVAPEDDVVPGITRMQFESASYIINGGNNKYFVVNAGYSSSSEKILAEYNGDSRIEWIFPTDCRDLHALLVDDLAQNSGGKIICCSTAADILRNPMFYQFPKNLPKGATNTLSIKDGYSMKWCGAEVSFHDLPGMGAGRQMMLFATPGSRVLFVGDVITTKNRLGFTHIHYGIDLRKSTIEAFIAKLKMLKPTHIANDWGIHKVTPDDFNRVSEWTDRLRDVLLDSVIPAGDYSRVDPYWVRAVPDVIKSEWGIILPVKVRIRNYTGKEMTGTIRLRGEYLGNAPEVPIPFRIEADSDAIVQMQFSILSECIRDGAAVGVEITCNGKTETPTQFIVLRKMR
jgi:hypothetical protein